MNSRTRREGQGMEPLEGVGVPLAVNNGQGQDGLTKRDKGQAIHTTKKKA